MTRENAKNIAEAISFKIQDRQRLSLVGVNELIDQIYNNHEAQLKAKDEEIERLKGKTQILEVLVDNTKDIIEAQTRMCRTKARSIVAMLFWVFAKNRRLHKTNKYFSQDAVTESYFCFQQAYKMLKAQQ